MSVTQSLGKRAFSDRLLVKDVPEDTPYMGEEDKTRFEENLKAEDR